MEITGLEKQAEKEFRRYARKNLPNPKSIKRIEQTQVLLLELHNLMNSFKARFNFIPDEAHLRFNTYKNIQDRMVYDNFKKSYQQVLC
jgi:hypothetical protein